MSKKIGNRLKKYRESIGIKLVPFSILIGISHGSLSGLENNKSKPSAETLASICLNTDLNIYWLLTGEGPMLRDPEIELQDERLAPGEWDEKGRIITKEGDPYEKTHGQDMRTGLDAISPEQAAANRAREENASLYNDRDLVENVPEQELKDKLIRTQEGLISTQGDLITQLKTRLTGIEGKLQALSEENKKIANEDMTEIKNLVKALVGECREIKERLNKSDSRLRDEDPEEMRGKILKKRAI